MDCIQAQAVVSETLDGSPVDAAVLEAAKAHCRECAQCAQYVRALSAVRRAVPPAPPADLADRIMTRSGPRPQRRRRPAALEAAQLAGDVRADAADAAGRDPLAGCDRPDRRCRGPSAPAVAASRSEAARMDRRQLDRVGQCRRGPARRGGRLRCPRHHAAGQRREQRVPTSTDAARRDSPESRGAQDGRREQSTASGRRARVACAERRAGTGHVSVTPVRGLRRRRLRLAVRRRSDKAPSSRSSGRRRWPSTRTRRRRCHAVYSGERGRRHLHRGRLAAAAPFTSVQRTYEDAVYALQSADLTRVRSAGRASRRNPAARPRRTIRTGRPSSRSTGRTPRHPRLPPRRLGPAGRHRDRAGHAGRGSRGRQPELDLVGAARPLEDEHRVAERQEAVALRPRPPRRRA